MNGYEIYRRALSLLGYLDRNGLSTDEESLLRRAYPALSALCSDLKLQTPATLTEEVSGKPKALEALSYGMAMLIALSEGDSASNRFFASVYNAKRAAALAAADSIRNVLPTESREVRL